MVKKSLEDPIRIIAENSGEEGPVVLDAIRKGKDDFGFDADAGVYGSLMERGIMDPAKVTRSAIENAASVAAMILTTESMITEIPRKEPAMPPPPPMDY